MNRQHSNNTRLESLALLLIFLDSIFVYFGKNLTGTILPVNAIVPLIFFIIFIQKGQRHIYIDKMTTIGLSLMSVGFLMGAIIIPELGIQRILEIGSALTAFLAGYYLFRWSDNADKVGNLFIFIGLSYAVVCTIALLKIMPGIFPLKAQIWSLNGTLVDRPEVTIDQNFQIFYLLPGVLPLILPIKKIRIMLLATIVIGSLYTLASLQTRSGMLIFIGVCFITLIAPFWVKELSNKRVFIIGIVTAVTIIISLPLILSYGHIILVRFFEQDYSTGLGRLYGFLFFFDHIYNPLWWIPHGSASFVQQNGDLPHSNITAVFLDGGIVASIGWFIVAIFPLIKLTRYFLKRKLNPLQSMALIGGIGMMILQLTLFVPLVDQVWLWYGIVLGTVANYKKNIGENNIQPNLNAIAQQAQNSSTSVRLRK